MNIKVFKSWNYSNVKASFATLKITSLPVKVDVTYPVLFVHDQISLAVLFKPHPVFTSDINICNILLYTHSGEVGDLILGRAECSKNCPEQPRPCVCQQGCTRRAAGWFSLQHCHPWAWGALAAAGTAVPQLHCPCDHPTAYSWRSQGLQTGW